MAQPPMMLPSTAVVNPHMPMSPAQPPQAWLYGVTAAAVAFFILSNVRRWWREARAQRLAAASAGYSSDWA